MVFEYCGRRQAAGKSIDSHEIIHLLNDSNELKHQFHNVSLSHNYGLNASFDNQNYPVKISENPYSSTYPARFVLNVPNLEYTFNVANKLTHE